MDMTNAIIWGQINEDIIDAEEQLNVGVDVLNKEDPFELSDRKFIKMFRLTEDLTRRLINIVSPHVESPRRASALTIETKVKEKYMLPNIKCLLMKNTLLAKLKLSASFSFSNLGYPTRPWILTPILNPETEQEEQFNERFCSIWCGIEHCIGVLKNHFRCLLKHRVLHYSPRVAATIVNACVVLHNMCIIATVPDPQEDDEGDIDFGIYAQRTASEDQRHNPRVNMDLLAARQLRQNMINNHFFKPWKHDIYKYNDCVYS
nr:unnamed protein product [Callosobruchus analis]